RHLLGDVGLDADVATPGGNEGGEALPGERLDEQWGRRQGDRHALARDGIIGFDADAVEQLALLAGLEHGTQEPVDPRRPEHDPGPVRLLGRGIDPAGEDGATGPLVDEPGATVGADPGEPELLALIEAMAGVVTEVI